MIAASKILEEDIIFHEGIPWRKYQGILLPDLAPHEEITVSKSDCSYLLGKTKAHLVRWHSGFDRRDPTLFWHVIKDGPATLEMLSANTRSKVRRGLKRCRIAITEAKVLAADGYPVYRQAFNRYRTYTRCLSEEEFRKEILARGLDPSWEFWGIWGQAGKLIGFSQNRLQGESCNYSIIKFDPDFLKLYPSYALFFEMNNHYLNERKLRYVNDGARSIGHATNIQGFLMEKFQFRKAYSMLHVVYNRKIGWAVHMLYPLRSAIFRIRGNRFAKASVLMRQEEIRKSFRDLQSEAVWIEGD